MKLMKKGISLIVLIITIIIIVMLATAIILSLSNSGIIDNAKRGKIKTDMNNIVAEYEMYKSDIIIKGDDVESINKTPSEVPEVISCIKGTEYQNEFEIIRGYLIYIGKNELKKELAISRGIEAYEIVKAKNEDDWIVTSGGVLEKYYGTDTSIVIPNKVGNIYVKTISSAIFQNNSFYTDDIPITDITISAGIETIEEGAFNIGTLKKIKISDGIKELKGSFGMTSIEEIILPNTLEKIGDSFFESCRKLKEIQIPDSVKMIGDSAFERCKELRKIEIPDSVKTIGTSAFEECIALKDVVLGKGVETIYDYAFEECTSLDKVEIQGNILNAGTDIFYRSTALKDIIIKEGVEVLNGGIFDRATSIINIEIPETLKSMPGENCIIKTAWFNNQKSSLTENGLCTINNILIDGKVSTRKNINTR